MKGEEIHRMGDNFCQLYICEKLNIHNIQRGQKPNDPIVRWDVYIDSPQ